MLGFLMDLENYFRYSFISICSVIKQNLQLPNFRIFSKYQKRISARFNNLRSSICFTIFCNFQFIQCFDLLYHYLLDDLCQKYYMDCSKFNDEKSRKNRAYSLVKWSYSIIYYLISSFWAYYLLKNTSYFPSWFGGIYPDGGFHNLHKYVPYQLEATYLMKVFYIFQFGKHFSRFFNHVFIRNEGNFFQYTLHHGLSTFLIIFSYLMNMWIIGIWVLLIHDLTQCSLIIMRGYDSYKYKKAWISNVTYITLGVLWISGRIILFWYTLVYEPIKQMFQIAQYKLQQIQIEYETLFIPYWFMMFMLTCLFLMQVYWTYCITEGILKRTLVKSIKTAYE